MARNAQLFQQGCSVAFPGLAICLRPMHDPRAALLDFLAGWNHEELECYQWDT